MIQAVGESFPGAGGAFTKALLLSNRVWCLARRLPRDGARYSHTGLCVGMSSLVLSIWPPVLLPPSKVCRADCI